MIREVQGAIEAYNGLDKLGKRLFRDETGLVSAQGIKLKRRKPRKAVVEATEATPVRRKATAVPTAASIPTVDGPLSAEQK